MIYPACKRNMHKTCPQQYAGLEKCDCECHSWRYISMETTRHTWKP